MMAMLAAAANGQTEVRAPHLVDALRGVARADGRGAGPVAERVSLVDAMQNRFRTKRPRSSSMACPSAIAQEPRASPANRSSMHARACAWIGSRGKTGTPTLPNDRALAVRARPAVRRAVHKSRDATAMLAALRPYKWYVAAYRTNPTTHGWGPRLIGAC
jgi:hypothetical protein